MQRRVSRLLIRSQTLSQSTVVRLSQNLWCFYPGRRGL